MTTVRQQRAKNKARRHRRVPDPAVQQMEQVERADSPWIVRLFLTFRRAARVW